MKSLSERFWSKVNKSPEGCWEWTGSIANNGYGHFNDKRLPTRVAHRIAWLLDGRVIPEGMEVCHKCDNRKCVRLDHLFVGTRSDNMQDCKAKGRLRFENGLAAAKLNPRKYHSGSSNHAAKLSESDVAFIKGVKPGYGVGVALAKQFGVSALLISGIQKGKRWLNLWTETPNTEPK